MIDQRAHVVYRRLLLGLGHGYPLWIPEPDQSLPAEYRCRGVSIGDVGLMTEDGGFDFLYNIHRAAGDPINGGRVPPDFHPLPLLDKELPIRTLPFMHKTKSIITSQHVVKRSLTVEASADLAVFAGGGFGFEYSTTKAEAALLALPDGATRYVARNRSVYIKYAKENGVSIYQYVNGTLGREAPNGSVYIVTGCDKCQSWGNAALSQPEDRRGVSLKFIAGGLADGGLAVHSASNSDFGMETRCYPPVQGYPTTEDENQCIFTRGIVIVARESFLMSKVLGPIQLVHISGSPKDNHRNPYSSSSWPPYSSSSGSGSGSTSSSSASHGGQTRSIGMSAAPSETSDDLTTFDETRDDNLELGLEFSIGEFPEYAAAVLNPSSYIGERVLSMCPTAQAAVVDDEIWMGALRPSEEENDVTAVVQKLLEHIVVEEVDGIATLIAPEAPHEESPFSIQTDIVRSRAEQTETVDQPSQISTSKIRRVLVISSDGLESIETEMIPNDASNFWGALISCDRSLPLKFDRRNPLYTVMCNRPDDLSSDFGPDIWDEHADIRWNEIDGEQSSVVVQNKSKYGTFINDYRIDAGGSQVLFEGDVISFGSMLRFIFRSFTTPSIGLFAEYDLISGISITWRATVMRAVERETCLFVAVKMLHYQGSDREIDSVLPAWKHTDILASLKHPNICSFKKMFKQRNGGRCLVMELVEGRDLRAYIHNQHSLGLIKELEEGKDVRAYMRKPRSLSEDIAQHFAYQLCDAFAFCHSKNFAHRNLTPQNILLTLDEPPQIKITDFGLEIPVTDRFDSQRLSCLAPELVTQDGIAAHGNLVDAWSIGAIVFHMLTNASPFDDGTRHADIDTWNANIEERIHTGQICWSVLREKELSPNAEDFIRRFLETDPADRMTCEVALVHPWLLTYRVIYDHCDFPDYQPPSARCNREVVQRDLSMMSADSLSDSDASGSHGANVSAPIQRRIDEDKEVADVGLSPDLIANFERLTNQSANEEVAPVNVNENEKWSLTPMAEDPAAESNASGDLHT